MVAVAIDSGCKQKCNVDRNSADFMLIVDNNTVQADDYSVICMLFRFVVNGQKHTEVLIHLFKLRKQIGWAATKRRS